MYALGACGVHCAAAVRRVHPKVAAMINRVQSMWNLLPWKQVVLWLWADCNIAVRSKAPDASAKALGRVHETRQVADSQAGNGANHCNHLDFLFSFRCAASTSRFAARLAAINSSGVALPSKTSCCKRASSIAGFGMKPVARPKPRLSNGAMPYWKPTKMT